MPTKTDILDLYFMDSRAKLLDIASYLDRLDRHEGETDFRQEGFLNALQTMLETKENRTAAVLNTLSDSSTDPIEAVTIQAAYGAPQLEN
jgi:hypothetical protein